MIVISLSGVIIISLVNTFGTDVTAAFGIGMQVDMLATIPFMSIGMAATSIAGQNLGARKLERVYATMRVSVYFALAIGIFCTIVLFAFPHQIGALFLEKSAANAKVLELVADYYFWMAFIFPCFAVIFVIQGVLRSAGDTMALLVLSFTAMFIIRIPLAYFLAGPAGLEQNGIWIAMLSSSTLAVGLNWLYYRGGRWKKRRIFEKAKNENVREV
jgi:Na+-driven multidrug efflux pump